MMQLSIERSALTFLSSISKIIAGIALIRNPSAEVILSFSASARSFPPRYFSAITFAL